MNSDSTPNLDHIAADLRPLAVPLATLRPDPDNARVGHDIPGLTQALNQYGQRVALVVNRSQGNKIEKGNGTYRAAVSLGWQHIAAVFVEDDPQTATGFSLADNRLSAAGRFDETTLARLLAEHGEQRPPGFTDSEVRALIAKAKSEHSAAQPAAVSNPHPNGNNGMVTESPPGELPAVTITADYEVGGIELGQLYEFESKANPGRFHRFLVGDSTNPTNIQRVLNNKQAANVITSPPYADQRNDHYGGVPAGEYVGWWKTVQAAVRPYLAADGSFFLNIRPHAEDGELNLYVYELVLKMREWGWKLIDELCWVRQGFPGKYNNRFKNAHEPVFQFARQTAVKIRPQHVLKETNLDYATNYQARGMNGNMTMGSGYNGQGGGRNVKAADNEGALPTNVITAYTGAHSTSIQYGGTFPLALPEFIIKAYSDPGDIILDLFGGSGTTMEAAEKCGRIAYLLDNNPEAAVKTIERMGLLGIRPRLVQETV